MSISKPSQVLIIPEIQTQAQQDGLPVCFHPAQPLFQVDPHIPEVKLKMKNRHISLNRIFHPAPNVLSGWGILLLCLCLLISGFKNVTPSEIAPADTATAEPAASAGIPEDVRIDFSHDSGCYPDDLTVTLTAPAGYTIAYTLDGTIPSIADDSGKSTLELPLHPKEPGYLVSHKDLMLYPEFPVIRISDNPELPIGAVLRAAPVSRSGICGNPETKVYFPGIDFTEQYPDIIVISAVLDPGDLLNYETGILAAGSVYDQWKQSEEAQPAIEKNTIDYYLLESNSTQHGRAWERPCLLQIYDGQNTVSKEINAGIRITGNFSRRVSQKSFNFYFRKDYGEKNLNYELFEGTDRYKSLTLKGGGNNTEMLKFKEVFLQNMVSDRDVVIARTRTAILFLNGEYWGPYTLGEKLSDQMFADRFGVDKEQVIIVKEANELEAGTDEDLLLYNDLMAYADMDLSDPEIYRQFCEVMDIRSMADFFAIQIYIGNADWAPNKNDVLWRTRDTSHNNGRWQYVLYDIEYSSGLYGQSKTAPETDHIRTAKEKYPLFAAAMKNREFAELFISSLKEVGSVNFAPEQIDSELQKYLNIWTPLMPDFYKRFRVETWYWDFTLDTMIRFFKRRYPIIMGYAEQ